MFCIYCIHFRENSSWGLRHNLNYSECVEWTCWLWYDRLEYEDQVGGHLQSVDIFQAALVYQDCSKTAIRWNQSAINLVSIYYQSTTEWGQDGKNNRNKVESVCYQSTIGLLSVYCQSTISLLSICYQSTIGLLSVCYLSTTEWGQVGNHMLSVCGSMAINWWFLLAQWLVSRPVWLRP